MNDDSTLILEFSSDWNILKELREKLKARLTGKLRGIADPIIMTSSELVENAIKYGESNFSYSLTTDLERVDILVSSTLGSAGNYRRLADGIQKIQASDDPFSLYTNRLLELLNSPKNEPTRIGLIRIAYEGKFSLCCELKNRQVRIRARRKIAGKNHE